MICREVRRGWCAAKYIFSTFPSLLILILIQYCTAVQQYWVRTVSYLSYLRVPVSYDTVIQYYGIIALYSVSIIRVHCTCVPYNNNNNTV